MSIIRSDNLGVIGKTWAGAASDETIVAKPSDGKIGLSVVVVNVPAAVVGGSITLKDGTTVIYQKGSLTGPDSLVLDFLGLELAGDFKGQVSATGITASAQGKKLSL